MDKNKSPKDAFSSLESKNNLENIKSKYILKQIFNNLSKKVSLQLIKYNKHLQKRLNYNINNYKEFNDLYSSIEIEIIPAENVYGKFNNIIKKENKNIFIFT